MEKKKLKILVVNRPLKPGEHPVKDIFQRYKGKYELIIFPWREDKKKTEVIFFDVDLIEQFEELFSISIELDAPGFFDFDLEDITEDVFYDVLDSEFEIDNFNLTDIEELNKRPVDITGRMNSDRSIPTSSQMLSTKQSFEGLPLIPIIKTGKKPKTATVTAFFEGGDLFYARVADAWEDDVSQNELLLFLKEKKFIDDISEWKIKEVISTEGFTVIDPNDLGGEFTAFVFSKVSVS